MNEVYVRLRDAGTMFHDPMQGRTVVRNRIGFLTMTANVAQAIHAGILVKLQPDKAQPAYEAQEAELAEQAEERRKFESGETVAAPKKGTTGMAVNPVMPSGIEMEDVETEDDKDDETTPPEMSQLPMQQPFQQEGPVRRVRRG